MSTINDWNKYINVVHELALVEADLREFSGQGNSAVETILFERF